MLRQVSDHVQTLVAQASSGSRQVVIHLHPQDWGQVRVSVTMTPTTQANGQTATQVVAHVVADQPAVKTALETHQADLRQSLQSAGLNLDRLTVTVRPDAGAQAGLGQGRSHDSQSGWQGTAPGQTSATGASGGAATGGGGYSSFAAFGQGGQGSQGRPQPQPAAVPAEQSAGADAEIIPNSATLSRGRLDTRA